MSDDLCKPAVIAPTFNNAASLPTILERLRPLDLPVFVVNDGSSDDTARFLADFAARPENQHVTILTHQENQGKASAMQTGFAAAHLAGFTHAITIDTDGQLDPEQIPHFVAKVQQHPTALVVGVRDDRKSDYPARSRFGRRFSNHMVRLQSGVCVSDSQCGLRAYPLLFVHDVKCRAQRFGYETEIITRAGWAGCKVAEVPVNCRYLPPGQRVSHFRPFFDSFLAVLMHGRLLLRALLPLPHARWPELREGWLPSWKSLREWLSIKQAWHQLRHDESGHLLAATGLAVGAFIANLPAYGFQTVLALYAARRLHLHPAPVVIGSQLSTPPIGFALVAMAVCVGHLLLHGSWPVWPEGGWTADAVWRMAPSLLKVWAVGSLIVGAVAALVIFLLSLIFFRYFFPRRATAPVEA